MRNSLFVLLILFVTNTIMAQHGQEEDIFVQQDVNILPPSPTAGELGKYGYVPVGLATGTARIDIPLYIYRTKNLSIPISMSYNSNGVRVDQISTWVGMNWSLNAGGVITRIIRDDADELGLDDQTILYPDNFDPTDPISVKYLETAGELPGFDTESDLYAFNFLGQTGKFLFDKRGVVAIVPYKEFVIERQYDLNDQINGAFIITTPDGIEYTFGAVEISRTDMLYQCGKNYIGGLATSWHLTRIEHPLGDVIQFIYGNTGSYIYYSGVSQTLTRSKRLGSAGPCEASCPQVKDRTCPSRLLVGVKHLSKIQSTGFGTVEFEATRDRSDVEDYKLNDIVIKDRQGDLVRKVSFDYAFSTASGSSFVKNDETLKHRMFLKSIIEKDAGEGAEKTHSFEYYDINGLPPRLSFAQDHGGFYNGKTRNTHLVAKNLTAKNNYGNPLFENEGGDREPSFDEAVKGMLEKITYPTKGTTTILYSQNDYRGIKTIFPEKLSVNVSAFGKSALYKDIAINYTQDIRFYASSRHIGEEAPDPIHDKLRVTVKDVATGETIAIKDVGSDNYSDYKDVPLNSSASGIVRLEAGHTYRFKLQGYSLNVEGGMSFEYYPSPPEEVPANIPVAGLRVSSLTNFDPGTNKSEIINYHYAKHDELSISTGKLGANMEYYHQNVNPYYSEHETRISCGFPCQFISCYYGSMSSNSANSLYNGNGNITYEYVTVSKGTDYSQGLEEHQFYIDFDYAGQQMWGEDVIADAPLTNAAWSNGLEKYTRFFKYTGENFVLLREDFNEYVADERLYTEVPSLVVRKKYEPVCTSEAVVTCTSEMIDKKWLTPKCVTNHDHKFRKIWAGPWGALPNWVANGNEMEEGEPVLPGLGIPVCFAEGAENKWVVSLEHPCATRSIGEEIVVPYALDYLDAIEYKTMSHWFYLKKTVQTTYDENGQNPLATTTEYFYDNAQHTQVTKTITTGSDGKQIQVELKYPHDYSTSDATIASLIEQNMVALPVKTEKTVAGNLTQSLVTVYNSKGLPLQKFQYEATDLEPPAVHDESLIVPPGYDLKIQFQYDALFNVKQVSTDKEPMKSFVWGHGNLVPVAEAVNAQSNQIFFTSFEDYSDQSTVTSTSARTGEKYWNSGTFDIESDGGFTSTGLSGLKMSYWFWDESSWVFSGEVDYNRNINRGSRLDNVRVYPAGSFMTTFTYDHDRKVTSISDPNDQITYYEYDEFGRLHLITDDQKNILKIYTYTYKK